MADNTEILITEILGHPYADWQALLETLREHYDVRSPAEGTTVVRRQAEALHRMKKCNARQVERIASLEAEVETMRVAAHELMVERDELQRTLDSLTQEYHLSKSECSERLRHGQTIEADGLATDKHDEQAR